MVLEVNAMEGFRLVRFEGEAEGRELGQRVCEMVSRLESESSLQERYDMTAKKKVMMYNFRPAASKAEYETFMQSMQRGADISTNLEGRPRPPKEVDALVRALDDAAPILRHYEAGWVQVNVTDEEHDDELNPHVDRAGWGDVIVGFTTKAIEVVLTAQSKSDPRAQRYGDVKFKTSIEVPANSAYMLAGHARTRAKHSMRLPKGRIGVVVRYYLRDLCVLGARVPPPGAQHRESLVAAAAELYRVDAGRVDQEVVARWPESAGGTSTYVSCYPGRLKDVCSRRGCKVAFFAHADDGNDAICTQWLAPHLVLPVDESTRWFNEPHDPFAATYRESFCFQQESNHVDDAAAALFFHQDQAVLEHRAPRPAFTLDAPRLDVSRDDDANGHPPRACPRGRASLRCRARSGQKHVDRALAAAAAAEKNLVPKPKKKPKAAAGSTTLASVAAARSGVQIAAGAAAAETTKSAKPVATTTKKKPTHRKKAPTRVVAAAAVEARDDGPTEAVQRKKPRAIGRAKKKPHTEASHHNKKRPSPYPKYKPSKKKPKPAGLQFPPSEPQIEPAAWEAQFDLKTRSQKRFRGEKESLSYPEAQVLRRLAAFLVLKRELSRKPMCDRTIWIPDRVFDSPDLALFFDDPTKVPPTRDALCELGRTRIVDMHALYVSADPDVQRHLDRVLNASSSGRARGSSRLVSSSGGAVHGADDDDENPNPRPNAASNGERPERLVKMRPAEVGDRVVIWHPVHQLWVPARVELIHSNSSNRCLFSFASDDADIDAFLDFPIPGKIRLAFGRGSLTAQGPGVNRFGHAHGHANDYAHRDLDVLHCPNRGRPTPGLERAFRDIYATWTRPNVLQLSDCEASSYDSEDDWSEDDQPAKAEPNGCPDDVFGLDQVDDEQQDEDEEEADQVDDDQEEEEDEADDDDDEQEEEEDEADDDYEDEDEEEEEDDDCVLIEPPGAGAGDDDCVLLEPPAADKPLPVSLVHA